MTLRARIVLWFSLAAAIPTALFGVYLGVHDGRAGLARARNELRTLETRLETECARYLGAGFSDLRFAGQLVEVRKLAEGVAAGDVDEIGYWSTALEKALVGFAENRRVFHELRFSATGLKSRVRVTGGLGKPVAVREDAGVEGPAAESACLKTGKPAGQWDDANGGTSLWLFVPVPGRTPGTLGGRLDLGSLRGILGTTSWTLERRDGARWLPLALPVNSDPEMAGAKSESQPVRDTGLRAESEFGLSADLPEVRLHLVLGRDLAEVWAPIRQLSVQTAVICTLATLLAVAFGSWKSRAIVRPVQAITGHLTEIARSSCQASRQVAVASQRLAEDANQQAANQEETSASIEEISSQIRSNTDAAARVNRLAVMAREAGDAGMKEVSAMDSAMTELRQSSDEIAKIVRTIDEIAFQTNLLALNAAVEAARAGEAGQGFAVVADEVRTLAGRCAGAARETADRVERSQASSRTGAELGARVGHALAQIVERVREVDTLATEVASVSREQSGGIRQIADAVTEIDRLTQANAGHADSCATAAADLATQSTALTDAIRELRHVTEGTGAAERNADPESPGQRLEAPDHSAEPTAKVVTLRPGPGSRRPTGENENGSMPRRATTAVGAEADLTFS